MKKEIVNVQITPPRGGKEFKVPLVAYTPTRDVLGIPVALHRPVIDARLVGGAAHVSLGKAGWAVVHPLTGLFVYLTRADVSREAAIDAAIDRVSHYPDAIDTIIKRHAQQVIDRIQTIEEVVFL